MGCVKMRSVVFKNHPVSTLHPETTPPSAFVNHRLSPWPDCCEIPLGRGTRLGGYVDYTANPNRAGGQMSPWAESASSAALRRSTATQNDPSCVHFPPG